MRPAAQSESSVQDAPFKPVPAATHARTGPDVPPTRLHFWPGAQPQLGMRPQGVSRQLEQLPVVSQTMGGVQVPQDPPHPLSPHVRPVQSGVHVQRPVVVSQVSGGVQDPHVE
jgi:hypothetical protein